MAVLQDLWRREPVRVVAVLASLIVFVLAKAGVVVDEQNVGEALLLVLPILFGGEAARDHVVPVHKLVTPPERLPRDEVDRREVQS